MITVLIVDGLPDVMQVLQMEIELESDFRVLGSVESAGKAIDVVLATNPDVVLVDTDIPGNGDLATVRKLKGAAPNIPIIILSLNDDRNIRREAREVGAVFVLKQTDLSALLEAIRQAALKENTV